MPAPLELTLTLDRAECLRGESLPFEVVLENRSDHVLRGLPTFEPLNRTLAVTLSGPRIHRTAYGTTPDERDGVHLPEMEELESFTLKPGQQTSLREDVLAWFGVLDPGSYELTARYNATGSYAHSQPVALKVTPAAPVYLATSRPALQPANAPVTVAWLHRDSEGFALFYQQLSSQLPRNPRVSVNLARTAELIEAWPAIESVSDEIGHLIWLDRRGRLQFGVVNVAQQRVGSAGDVKMPFPGRPLASPASMPDGRVFAPVTDLKRKRIAVLQMDPKGGSRSYDLDLGRSAPLGPYVCFWEYDAFLHFAWTTLDGFDVQYARLPLADPAAGFAARGVYLANEPILALEAYMDLDAPLRERAMLEHSLPPEELDAITELLPPRLMLWCVSRSPDRLVLTRVNVAENRALPAMGLATGLKDLRVHRSVVTCRNDLIMILADSEDRLHYASTTRPALLALQEVTGKEITLEDHPGLLASSRAAVRPWVYLTYIDRQRRVIDYIRLEPADEQDPVERSGEMRGRGVAKVS